MTEVAYLVFSLLLIVALANSSRRRSPPSLRTGGPSTGPTVDTCTSRTSWKPTRSGASVRRRQVDPVLRDGASR